jgi:AraC-like DNA-binding protein
VITISFSGALTLIALAFSLLLAFKLLTQSGGDTIANALLATVCFALSVWTATSLARDLGLYAKYPHLMLTVTPGFYLLGPALLAYTQRITTGRHPFAFSRSWLHLIPFTLFVIAAIPFYQLNADEKLRFFQEMKPASLPIGIMLAIMVPQMFIYSFLCLRPIRQYQAKAKDHFSDLERGNLRWLKRLCIGMLILVFMDAVLGRLMVIIPWTIDAVNPSTVMRVGLLFYILFLAFSALGQPAFMYIEAARSEDTPVEPDTSPAEKYARSGLREDSAQYYVAKLQTLMNEQKVFLDCDLTLRTLSAQLKLRPHHLSQILNEQLKQSFYDFINEHRIAYAKDLLISKPEMSILDVSFASGYQNKVSFYSAFKRFVGGTPTRYREEHTRAPSPPPSPLSTNTR